MYKIQEMILPLPPTKKAGREEGGLRSCLNIDREVRGTYRDNVCAKKVRGDLLGVRSL